MLWIDYCNCVFAGQSAYSLAHLQSACTTTYRRCWKTTSMASCGSAHSFQTVWLYIWHFITSCLYTSLTSVLHRHQYARCFADDGKLEVPQTSTVFSKWTFSVSGQLTWNTLPTSVGNAPTLGHFTTALKTHLFMTGYHLLTWVLISLNMYQCK